MTDHQASGIAASGHASPAWCAVANMANVNEFGPGGAEKREGSRHFLPGTKIYVLSHFWGQAGEAATVVGRHRSSKKFITIVIASQWLANWRVELVYSPLIVRQLGESGEYDPANPGSEKAKRRAEEIVAIWQERGAKVQDPRTTRGPHTT